MRSKFFLPTVTLISVASCKPSQAPTLRSQARSALYVAAMALQAGEQACVDRVDQLQAKGQDAGPLARKCVDALNRGRAAALIAESVIDAWSDADAARSACALKESAKAVGDLAGALKESGVDVPVEVEDAVQVASYFGAACTAGGDHV